MESKEQKEQKEKEEKQKCMSIVKNSLREIEKAYKILSAIGALNEAAYLKKSMNELKKTMRLL